MRSKDEPSEPIEVVGRVDAFAREAGLLPELVSVGKRPDVNPRHWLYRAICLRMTWNEHTLVTPKAFNEALATVGDITIR